MSETQNDRHELTKRIFLDAIESGVTRPGLSYWLNEKCGSDRILRAEVEKLLLAAESSDSLCDLSDQKSKYSFELFDFMPGQWIGSYQIESFIGEGGMGVVYQARQLEPIERTVAIKMVKPGMDSREMLRRFQWEQTVLARLEHPNIARILDAGQTDHGRPYFVMEFVSGQPLIECCDRYRRTLAERMELFESICSAIRFAHQNGVLHRDIKPGNLLVTGGDGEPNVKVIDFGIAKLLDGDNARLTRLLHVLGTQPYMSPEQGIGSTSKIDTRADVFSLGVVLHELLAGRPPDIDHFFQPTVAARSQPDSILRPSKLFLNLDAETRSRIAHDRQTTTQQLDQFLGGDLDWILMKAIGRLPSERYESVESFADDLSRLSSGFPVQARRQTKSYLAAKFLARNKAASLLVSAAVVFLVLAFLVSLHQVRVTTAAHQRSEQLRMGLLAAQQHTLTLVEAADLRLAAKAIDDGDYLEAADILDRQSTSDAVPVQLPKSSSSVAHRYLHTRLQQAGNSRLETDLPLLAMAFNPPRNAIVVGGEEGVIRSIDLEKNIIGELPSSGQASIATLAFAADHRELFSGGDDGSIKSLDFSRPDRWRMVCKLSSEPIDFCVSRDNRYLFVVDGSTDVLVIEIESGRLLRRLSRHKGAIYGIAISRDGNRIVTTSKDQTSVVWQWPSGEVVKQTERSEYRLVDVAMDAMGMTVVDGSVDGEIRLIDVENGSSAVTIRVPSAVTTVDLTADGRAVVAGCRTGMVYHLTRDDFERSARDKEYSAKVFRKSRHQAHSSRIQACLYLDPESVFSIGSDGRLTESNFRSRLIRTAQRTSKTYRFAVSADGRWIAAHDYRQLELIETRTGRGFRLDAQLPDGKYAGLNFSPRGELFLATQQGQIAQITIAFPDDNEVDVADDSIPASLRVFDAPGEADCAEIHFSSDGDRMMLFSRRNSLVSVVDISERKVLLQKKATDSYTADLSPSGRFLASSCRGELFIYDVDSGRKVATSTDHHSEAINDIRFSPDERWVYTASNDRRIKRWDYERGVPPELVGVQPGDVPKFLSLSRDGETLLSSGRDQQVWLWHTQAMQKLFPIVLCQEGHLRTHLSADDSTLIGLDRRFQLKWLDIQDLE